MQCAGTVVQRAACVAMAQHMARTCRLALATPTLGAQAHKALALGPTVVQRFFRMSRVAMDHPPHTVVAMPALSPTMAQGIVSKWLKKEGEEIMAGDVIAEIETDKATMEFEYGEDCYLAKILAKEGPDAVPVGQPLCVIVEDKADVGSFTNFEADAQPSAAPAATPPPSQSATPAPVAEDTAKPPPAPEPKAAPTQTPQAPAPKGDIIRASPLAKRLANEKGFDLSQIKGTGDNGRVTEKDIYAYEKSGAAKATAAPPAAMAEAPTYVEGTQKLWPSRLLEAKQTVPHYYLTSEINLEPIISLEKELATGDETVGVTSFLLKACALASKKVPACNSSWLGTAIRQYTNVDIALVVPGPEGPVTPLVEAAETKGLCTLSAELKSAVEKAKAGVANVAAKPGTIAVHSAGMEQSALLSAAAIILPPHSAALTIGHPMKRLVPGPDGKAVTASIFQATLSCDHRVVDGAVGAEWLREFKALCEQPMRMLL